MIKKFLLSLCAGIVIAITLFLQEPWLKTWLENKVIDGFAQALDCSVSGKLQNFHIIFPSICLEDMVMSPRAGKSGWQWRCKRFILRTSWWRLLREKTVALNIAIEDLHADSAVVNGKFAIEEHIQKMIEDTPLPVAIALNSVIVRNGTFMAHEDSKKIEFQCQWDSTVLCPGKDLDLVMNIKHACLKHDAACLVQQCVGSITCAMNAEQPLCSRINFSYVIPSLDERPCTLSALYEQDELVCSLATHDKSIAFENIRIHKESDQWHLTVAGSAQLKKLLQPIGRDEHISGECALRLVGVLGGTYPFKGSLAFGQVCHTALAGDATASINFEGDVQALNGSINCATPVVSITGDYAVDIKNRSVRLAMHNNEECKLSFTTVPTQSCSLVAKVADWDTLCGDILLSWTDEQKTQFPILQGKMSWPYFHCDIPLPGVRSFIKHHAQTDIQSDGIVSFHGQYTADAVAVDIVLHDGMIRLPQTYNFINALSAAFSFDPHKNKVVAENISIGLHRGAISLKNAQCHFKENSFTPHFIYIPCTFENLFINFKKDLFTTLSGSMIIEKRDQDAPRCKGHLILDRSQLKENLFSLAFQKQLFSHTKTSLPPIDARFDIAVETKEPIRVRTALLDANVKVQGRIEGSIADPQVSGHMSIMSGTIALPHQSLFITKGVVSCLPATMHDPYIEFVAKNRIKKYNITMSMSGSLAHPAIMLESSPPLTQEQIIALLLGGSEDSLTGAIAGALSTVLVHNIKHIIFDTEHSPSKLHSAIDRLFSPFKHVRLVPSFADQTGRAGIRGAIEIDIGERWHGLIQKNFSLSEDVRFEASYAIADDLLVRGFRDEHRDLGAEVEFRWKF